MSNKLIVCVILFVLNIILLSVFTNCTSYDILSRKRRQLLWPNSTLLQIVRTVCQKIYRFLTMKETIVKKAALEKFSMVCVKFTNPHWARVVDYSPFTVLYKSSPVPSSRLNIGIGTPSPAEKINVNWAFQANFQLPWNRSQIPMDILEANTGYDGPSRKKRDTHTAINVVERDGDYESDAKLCHFYMYVEEVLNSFHQNGTACVLQALCQLGALPLHSHHEDDLLHEVASFVLNPTNDIAHGVKEIDDDYRYIEAYKNGEKGKNCQELYNTCTTSLIDMFSVLSL